MCRGRRRSQVLGGAGAVALAGAVPPERAHPRHLGPRSAPCPATVPLAWPRPAPSAVRRRETVPEGAAGVGAHLRRRAGPGRTPAVLDGLDALGLRATFFCLGERVEALRGSRGRDRPARATRSRPTATATSTTWPGPRLGRPRPGGGRAGPWRPAASPPGGTGRATASSPAHPGGRPPPGLRLVLWSAWGREWTTSDPADVAAADRPAAWPRAPSCCSTTATASARRACAGVGPAGPWPRWPTSWPGAAWPP